MIHRKVIYTVIFFIGSLQVLTAQTESVSELYLTTRIVNGKTFIRWSPGDYDSWRMGMENGYMIHVTRTNNTTEESTGYILHDSIYPFPEGSWNNPQQNEYIDLAHAICYDFSQPIYEGPQGAYTAAEDQDNRFNFMLLTADIDFSAAYRMGLAQKENNIQAGYTYEYKVFMIGSDLQSNTSSVNADSIPPLPRPDGLSIQFGKEEFYLNWQKADLIDYYTTYNIEYSDDGGATFQAMNERPYVYFENPDISTEAQQQMTYRDSISPDIPEYHIRVRGRNIYGQYGPPSQIVSGRSVPDPILVFPRITEVLELADSSFRVSWAINEAVADSILGINILRYEEFPGGEATLLTPDSLAPSLRTFMDAGPMSVNYYQVEVIDLFGYRHTSAAGLGQLTDSIPPAVPTGLVGTIDTLSDSTMLVQVSWSPNQEDDFAGYNIYRSNNPDHEFAHLTTSGYLTDTVYTDIFTSLALADFIYYRVRAVDFSGNLSDFSEIIAIERPDMIPPAPPALGLVADEDGLEWMNSSSKDVVSYRIERRPYDDPEAWNSLGLQAKSNNIADMIPKSIMEADEDIYVYRVVAIDDAGLESASNEVTVRPSPLEKKPVSKMLFNLEAEQQDQGVVLRWRNNPDLSIKKVVIYRAMDGAALLELAHVDSGDLNSNITSTGNYLSFQDIFIEEDRTYLYKVQLQYEDGDYSNISNEALIQL